MTGQQKTTANKNYMSIAIATAYSSGRYAQAKRTKVIYVLRIT